MAPNINHAPTMPVIQTAFHFPANATVGRLATSMTAQTTAASDARVTNKSTVAIFPLFGEARTAFESTILAQISVLRPEPLSTIRGAWSSPKRCDQLV